MELGQIVRCIEKPVYIHGVTLQHEYVVNKVVMSHGHKYIKLLGDDDRAHTLLAAMFRKA